MKVIESKDWQTGSGRIYEVEEVIAGILYPYPREGRMEQMEAEIEVLRSAVNRLMAMNIKTVDDLNKFVGYERFKEVK